MNEVDYCNNYLKKKAENTNTEDWTELFNCCNLVD